MSLACDTNVYPLKVSNGPMRGPFSIRERCFLGKNMDEHIYDFVLDFLRKYKNKPKYSYNEIVSGHEITSYVSKYSDVSLFSLFK